MATGPHNDPQQGRGQGRGARPKPNLGKQRTSDSSLEHLEQVVLKGLCNCGGSLTLTALREALVDDLKIGSTSSEAGLRSFLTSTSPHNVSVFRLDDDARPNECTVRAKTDAVLCQVYKPRHDSCRDGESCQSFHLCSHFVSDKCKRGKKCNWPHTLRSNHNMNILQQNGLAHLEDEDIMQILRQSWIEITVCKYYNTQAGCKNEGCNFLHICRHYVLGDCRFSNANKQDCRYSHNVKDTQPLGVWKWFHVDARTKSPLELLQMLQEKKKQKTPSSDDEDEDEDDDDDDEALTSSGMRSDKNIPDICIHYNGKGCNNGNKCSYLHICRFFVLEKCKFSTCRHSHDIKSSQAMAAWEKSNIDAQQRSPEELLALIRKEKSQGRGGGDNVRSRKQSEHGAADGLDKNEICEYNLRGKCYFGDDCRKLHTEQNYQWQCSDDGGQTWTSFGANVDIEKRFCDFMTKVDVKLSDGSKSMIDFKTMKWTESSTQQVKTLEVRRLETPMTILPKDSDWQNVMRTNWQWYYLDNGPVWVQYPQNTEIEEAYQTYKSSGQDSEFDFETEQFRYVLDFSNMQQRNKKLGTKREVRRRPIKFLTKEMLDRSLQKLKTLATLAVILPKTWDAHAPTDAQNNFALCKLDRRLHKEEYDSVSQRFGAKISSSCILKIERVQNQELWHDFVQKRDRMRDRQEDSSIDPEELLLFHGTEERVVKAICQQNFDFRISGSRVGTKYGSGSYFSKDAKYSDCYASPDARGKRRMFLVRVLVGSYTKGNPTYNRPPLKDASMLHGPMFDSCVDNVIDPLIFVIFDRCQVYPDYLITYRQ